MQISDILIYDIKDEMDGTYSLIKTTGKKKNDYIKFYIQLYNKLSYLFVS